MDGSSTRKERALLAIGSFSVFGMVSYFLGFEQPLELIVQFALWIAILVCAIMGLIPEEKPDEGYDFTDVENPANQPSQAVIDKALARIMERGEKTDSTDSPRDEPVKLHFETEEHYLATPYADTARADFITVGDRVVKSRHGESEPLTRRIPKS